MKRRMNSRADYLFLGKPQVKDLIHDFDALMLLNEHLKKPVNLQRYLTTLADLRDELDARVERCIHMFRYSGQEKTDSLINDGVYSN